MKDLIQFWNKISGRRYSAVNTSDRELGDLSNNRLQKSDIDTFERNLSECETFDAKFNSDDSDFNDKKDAIINRLFERRKSGQLTRHPKCLFITLLLGFIALGSGCFILFVHPYDFFFKQKVVLSDGAEIYEMWRKPEVDLYIRVFLFNVTNAEEYMNGVDNKLKLREVGPYVYRESLEHKVTEFNDNGTLSAVPLHPLTWVGELSEGHTEEDMLYLPHIALLSIANVVSRKSFVTKMGLNSVIGVTGSKPLAKMTAREFMMGYKSNLMSLGNTFLPGWIYFDKLGLIDRMYDFDGDYETIFTGENDVNNAGLIDTYRGSTDLPQWKGKHCSNVQYASDGTKFKGGVQKNESLLFYRKSMCRAAPLIPHEEGVRSGLSAILYTFPEDFLDNGKHNADNKCFCREGRCLPEGLLDVSECYYGFPIALSYPHFYLGDDVLFSKVEGLSPNKEKHETRFWIEPVSGLPLDVSAKIQINMALEDLSGVMNVGRFKNTYLPLLWFDIRMYALPSSMEERFKLYLNVLPTLEQSAMYILFSIAAALIIITVYSLTFKVMFKTVNGKRQKNFIISSQKWQDKERSIGRKDGIYSPCEIPLNYTSDSDASDPQINTERKPSIFKTHSDKIKELSQLLSDKVYDTAGGVKDKVRDEITNVRNIFNERKDSLINRDDSNTNEAYKSDSSDNEKEVKGYQAVGQLDSDDDCKYLEVVDDGEEFGDINIKVSYADNEKNMSERARTLNRLESKRDNTVLNISD